MGKFRHCLTELSVRDTIMAGYYSLTFLLQTVSIEDIGDNLHESQHLFSGKIIKHIVCCLQIKTLS